MSALSRPVSYKKQLAFVVSRTRKNYVHGEHACMHGLYPAVIQLRFLFFWVIHTFCNKYTQHPSRNFLIDCNFRTFSTFSSQIVNAWFLFSIQSYYQEPIMKSFNLISTVNVCRQIELTKEKKKTSCTYVTFSSSMH